MSMTTELAQRMKAAALKAKQANDLYLEGKITLSECVVETKDHLDYSDNPNNTLALVEALEALRHERDELQQGFIANQEEAREAIKYATELKEQLARARSGCEEAVREVEGIQKILDHIHRRRVIWRGKAVTADAENAVLRQRIAELEARTVKLPATKFCPAEYAGSQLWEEVEIWNKAIEACDAAIRAAGVAVEGE